MPIGHFFCCIRNLIDWLYDSGSQLSAGVSDEDSAEDGGGKRQNHQNDADDEGGSISAFRVCNHASIQIFRIVDQFPKNRRHFFREVSIFRIFFGIIFNHFCIRLCSFCQLRKIGPERK